MNEEEFSPPTLKMLDDTAHTMSGLANDLDFCRRIEGLSEEDKTEIWNIVLELTRYSSALGRIYLLSK